MIGGIFFLSCLFVFLSFCLFICRYFSTFTLAITLNILGMYTLLIIPFQMKPRSVPLLLNFDHYGKIAITDFLSVWGKMFHKHILFWMKDCILQRAASGVSAHTSTIVTVCSETARDRNASWWRRKPTYTTSSSCLAFSVIEVFGGVFVLSLYFLESPVVVRAFVIGLSQIYSIFSSNGYNEANNYIQILQLHEQM